MKTQEEPHVLSADRLDGSVIISFNDGRCAIYSSALLYATISQAEELNDPAEEESTAQQTSARVESLVGTVIWR